VGRCRAAEDCYIIKNQGALTAMLATKHKEALTVPLAILGLGTGLLLAPARSWGSAAEKGALAAEPRPAVSLGLAEYKELKSILDIKNQLWATIPWKYSITEARKLAAATRKPIFMVVNTGNALGCT
jgi:hypothetical protein